MLNRLASETSPYLLQHANNPVDWYPWGDEALSRAKAEARPIFLSIGYSACHWCHVMEHESFEDAEIARRMNENFVCIKVDREERPDLDHIYMSAVQMISGRGGWPMSVFLTPELEPFFGGTYWPPSPRQGMPGFGQVLSAVIEAWQNRRQEVIDSASKLTAEIAKSARLSNQSGELSLELMHAAVAMLERSFDHQHGGFGGAPKFPHPMDLRVLLRAWRREPRDGVLHVVTHTLDRMAAGGIYDQLGGGFHRYSVDERWLVPHFEKMLYDNALLAVCYLEAYQATGHARFARVARETLDYVLRDLRTAEGGFASTEDADSEGMEGKFYVWTPVEVAQVLGQQAAETFCYVYDVSELGNFEDKNILNLPKTLEQSARILQREVSELEVEMAESRGKLLAARGARTRPGLDDKVLVSWNGLMIDALAQAASVLDEPRYLEVAMAAAQFILGSLRAADGRLLHSWRSGRARFNAYLDDYACLTGALVSLYEASFDERWVDEAVGLAEAMLSDFEDEAEGGFYFTATGQEALVARTKDAVDSSVPSGNGMAATVLLRLGKLTGRTDFLQAAERTLRALARLVEQAPAATGQLLLAIDMALGDTPELVLLGGENEADNRTVLDALRRCFWPNKVVAFRSPDRRAVESRSLTEIFASKSEHAAEPVLYVCRNFSCQAPVKGAKAILAALAALGVPDNASRQGA